MNSKPCGLNAPASNDVAAGHARSQRLRQRLAEGAALHAERLEDVLLDVLVERLARNDLDDVPAQRRGPVRIRRVRAIAEVGRRRPHARRLVRRQPFAERQQIFGRAREQVADAAVLEAAGVRHDVAHLHRLGEGRVDLEILQVRVDVGIEIDLALLDQLHDRRPGEQLRDRAGTEQRLRRIHRRALLRVLVAVALLEEHLAVLHDDDRGAGDRARLHLRVHEAVDERFHFFDGGRAARRERPCGLLDRLVGQ